MGTVTSKKPPSYKQTMKPKNIQAHQNRLVLIERLYTFIKNNIRSDYGFIIVDANVKFIKNCGVQEYFQYLGYQIKIYPLGKELTEIRYSL